MDRVAAMSSLIIAAVSVVLLVGCDEKPSRPGSSKDAWTGDSSSLSEAAASKDGAKVAFIPRKEILCPGTAASGSPTGNLPARKPSSYVLTVWSFEKAAVGDFGHDGFYILFVNRPMSCAERSQAIEEASVMLATCDAAPGDYPINSVCHERSEKTRAYAIRSTGPSPSQMADTGKIKIEQMGSTCGSRAKGSFELTFPDGTLSGTFDAPYCGAFGW